MKLRRYKAEDKAELDQWFQAHGMVPTEAAFFPPLGFICPGVAVGFVAQTDSGVALMDHYLTNPLASYKERQDALDSITEALLGAASTLGYKRIVALTTAQGIYERALRFGFQDIGNFRVLRLG